MTCQDLKMAETHLPTCTLECLLSLECENSAMFIHSGLVNVYFHGITLKWSQCDRYCMALESLSIYSLVIYREVFPTPVLESSR